MALGCLRTKACKICLSVVLVVFSLVFVVLWHVIQTDGAVQYVIPVQESTDVQSLSILPKEPIVHEGHSAQLVCIANGISHVRFLPPSSLPDSLSSSIHISYVAGGAVMIIYSVTMEHAGVYVCNAMLTGNQYLQHSVELVVVDGTDDNKLPQKNHQSPLTPTSHTVTTLPHNTSSLETLAIQFADNDRSTSQSVPDHVDSSPQQLEDSLVQRQSEDMIGQIEIKNEPLTENTATQEEESYEERGKFQRSAVDHYCSLYYDNQLHSPLPQPSSFAYNRHTLFDNTHRVVFCFLPKVGCTNLKLLFFVSQGLIPRTELGKPRDQVNQDELMHVVLSNNLETGDKSRKLENLKTYFKFVMVRNPLERLASGFRSKIERFNLTGNQGGVPHYNWARRLIFKKIHPDLFQQWIENGQQPVAISFSDFISYWLNPDSTDFIWDDHFMPMARICQPCATRFDYYGNFNHFDRDAAVLIDKIGASSSDLRQGYYSEQSSTDQRMKLYYSTLTDELKIAVVRKLALDLEFYYTIFPEERDIHKHILDLNIDLKLPS